MNIRYPPLRGKCDEACLGLCFDPVPKEMVLNVLQSISGNPIKYDNTFPMKKRALISERQVKYVEDIIFKIETENLGCQGRR